MRYLSALSSPAILDELERATGPRRLRPVKSGETLASMDGERFAGIIADHAAQLPLLRHGLPVVLLVPSNREGLRQFRNLAEEGVDVRLWTQAAGDLSDSTLRSLCAPRPASPATSIVAHLRGRFDGLAADVLTACAYLSNTRRSMDEIARVCGASASEVRTALREAGLVPISGVIAQMRALHAVWAWEAGRTNFWSSGGFRTLADLSAHLSQHTGSPLGRWKTPGGFSALLQSAAINLSNREEEAARAG
jgi:hypothetical protein